MSKPKPAPRPATPARRPLTLGMGVVAVVLALLVLAFFHEVMLEGKTFSSPDAQAPAGFVKIGERSLYQDRVYPLWNPYVFLGMPSFASGTYNPHLYPPDWPLSLIHQVIPLPNLTWLILYYFLGGLFTALLAREWGARLEGALLAGALFTFLPNLVAVGSHGHGSQLVDSAYLPLILWLAARWLRRGGVHHVGWMALAGGFQMLRGHAQIVYYTWLATGLYVLIELGWALARRDTSVPLRVRLVRAGAVAAAMLLAFGIAGVYNLPLRDYARQSIRGGGADGGVGMDYATAWSLAPYELGTLVAPNAVGFGGATYWGGMPFTDYPNVYVGIVAMVFALPALLHGGAPRLFALVLAVFSLLVAFGEHTPFYGLLYRWLPLFNKFRVPVMIVLLTHLAVALAVAWGWTHALAAAERAVPAPAVPRARAAPARPPASDADRAFGRLLIALAVLLGLVLAAGALGGEALRAGYVRSALAHRPQIGADAAELGFRNYAGDLVRVGFTGLIAVGLVALARRRTLAAVPATALALVLLLFDVWPVSRELTRGVIAEPVQNTVEVGRDDVVDSLEVRARAGLFRVMAVEEFRSNRFTGFGIQAVGGYHAAKPRIAQDLFDRNAQLSIPWLQLLNARYLVTQQRFEQLGLQLAFVTQSAQVYEIPGTLPRVTVLGHYRVAPFDSTLIDGIATGAVDAATTVTLERDPRLTLGPVAGARTRVTKYGLNDVTVEVDTPGPALVRLADLWSPDWRATVDGRPAPVLRADYLLRAVPVPAGRHVIEFHYRPAAVRNGLMVSLASLALVLVLLVLGVLRRGRGHAMKEAEAA